MLEIRSIREQKDELAQRLSKRGVDHNDLLNEAISIDEKRRNIQQELDDLQARMNTLSKEIGDLFKLGEQEKAEAAKQETADLKSRIQGLKEEHDKVAGSLRDVLVQIPNAPHGSVPAGTSEADNEVVDTFGDIPQLPEGAKAHWELGKEYGLFDMELGVKISGAGFPVYMGKGAKLERSLIAFFLDRAIEAGYKEVVPPLLVNERSAFATGQLPDKEGQMYHATEDDLYLIPTAEVPITNIYRDVIVDQKDLPVKMVGYTPCFRREAGSYGKDVRGLNRVHQFDKVEIVQIVEPSTSYEVLDTMVEHVKKLLTDLELPFRILRLCGGDLGFTSAITFDMEVYSAAQKKWLEVSSISNFETFQSNRLKCRYKGEDKKAALVHTLNGSALALARIFAALVENGQTPEGIRMPKALVPYTGFEMIEK